MNLYAQNPLDRIPGVRGMRSGTGTGQDSLKRRDNTEDSITIRFRYLDTSRLMMLDSSVTDFRVRFPLPMDYTFLGNLGLAAKPYAFSPRMVSGWDPGFHAFDIYKLRLDRIKFYQTTGLFHNWDTCWVANLNRSSISCIRRISSQTGTSRSNMT